MSPSIRVWLGLWTRWHPSLWPGAPGLCSAGTRAVHTQAWASDGSRAGSGGLSSGGLQVPEGLASSL